MTLIAAYKQDGLAVLIGDVTLTNSAKGDNYRSVRKKIYKISENFAIGWAGSPLVAKIVISDLRKMFSNEVVTKSSLENFFKSYDPDDFGSLHTNFIGWVIDDESYCFRWNCLYTQEVFYDSCFFDGSGEEYFESLKKQLQSWEGGGGVWKDKGLTLVAQEQALLSVINDVAYARFDESLYSKTWDRSFGISYDILAFIDGRFRYVRSIAYIGWDYFWDSRKGTGRLEQAPVIVKHNCMVEHSIIQETLSGKHFDGRYSNYLSRPVYDDMPEANLSNFPFILDSDYFANYFLFRENGKVIFKILLTVQLIKSDGPLRIKQHRNGAYYLTYDTDTLDQIYRKHIA
ncbi:hypothetical protein [Methylobacter sp. BBA5.1]|uniref:hypothetical protein n=1 Tax=Methylobacter sp. BBA5.1 TaxID=1495064 RepID=UPI000559C773|nr:hypothetical protein [Methylobacter sp. BBA5.1]